MKLLSRCKSVDSTHAVVSPLELLTRITDNPCSVTSSAVDGLAMIDVGSI
ncbi:hypothetical protein Hanom_Chr02g00143091 [Helianthus anomalus]